MANLEYCFFCCENISGNHQFNNIDKVAAVERVDYFNHHDSEINSSEATKEHVLRISHYLKVPRKLIDQERGAPSMIKCCPDCTKITENLSDYCAQLEIIKMKISYYLAKLNSKITSISTDANNHDNQRDCMLSDLQRSVHQKCLQKTQNDDSNRYPEIRLRKLPNPPGKLVHQLKSEDVHQYPVILEEIEDQIKIETDPTFLGLPTNQEINQELQSNLNPEHPEPAAENCQKLSGAFKCKTCGKFFTLRINLRRHVARSSICSQADNPFSQSDRYKFSKCEYCGMLVYSRNLKRHLDYRHPNGVTLTSKRKQITCEHCNLTVGNSKKLRIHMQESHGVEMSKRLFNCGGCDNSYELKASLNRHLRKSEKCRLSVGKVHKLKYSKVGQQSVKRENSDLVIIVPETDEDFIMTTNDIALSIDDPLAI